VTLDKFSEISATRIPTPEEFIAFAESQEWRIVVMDENRAALKVRNKDDELAQAFAKMMAREPYRTNVLNVVRENDKQPTKVALDVEPEPEVCKECKATWYAPLEEIREAVQSPHYCAQPRCPYRMTSKRNG